MKSSIFTILTASLLLIGCSGGNVSSSNEQSESAESNNILERAKSIFKTKNTTVTTEMEILPLINQAAEEWLSSRDIIELHHPYAYERFCYTLPEITDQLKGVERIDIQKYIDETIAPFKELPAEAKKTKDVQLLFSTVDAFKNGDMRAICARFDFIHSSAPVSAWWVNNYKDQAFHMLVSAYIANEVGIIIVKRLKDVSHWKDDVTAKEKINRIIEDLSADGTLAKIRGDAVNYGRGNKTYNIDATGKNSSPVHYIFDNLYDVIGASKGTVLSKNGGVIFGDGYIGGKKYTIKVEVADGSNMSKQSSIKDESKTHSETGLTESIDIGN